VCASRVSNIRWQLSLAPLCSAIRLMGADEAGAACTLREHRIKQSTATECHPLRTFPLAPAGSSRRVERHKDLGGEERALLDEGQWFARHARMTAPTHARCW
jgi:hypothetical protein